MVLMGFHLALFTLFLLNVRKGNGQLCKVSFVAPICCKCNIFFPLELNLLPMFQKLQITVTCMEEYMLFVNYFLDLSNGINGGRC